LPTIYWVDQELPGTPPSRASFNSFEQAYFDWLSGMLTYATPAADLLNSQIQLITTLNEVIDE